MIRFVLFAVIIVVGFFILIGISGSNSEKDDQAINEKHCAMNWETMSVEEKESALDEFTRESGSINNGAVDLGVTMAKLIKASVKYPETVMVDGKELEGFLYLGPQAATITNVEEGLITYYKPFTSKNKLNMDERMGIQLDIKYNAGCNSFELVDFKVE